MQSYISLVEICDRKSVHNLLLMAVLPFLQLNEPIPPHPALPPAFHSGCSVIAAATLHSSPLEYRAIEARDQLHVVMRHREVEDAETSEAALVRRRLHNAVDRAFVESPREEVHRVARVDHLQCHDVTSSRESSHEVRRTRALSMCLTHRHFPSEQRICRAEIGWLQRMVTLPRSAPGRQSLSVDRAIVAYLYGPSATHFWSSPRPPQF